MEDPIVPSFADANSAVWPPAPMAPDAPMNDPIFFLVSGNGFITVQIMSIAITMPHSILYIRSATIKREHTTIFQGIGYLIHTLALVVVGVFFLIYIHQTMKSLCEAGVTGLQCTPGWAVGWFFVPIMSLYMPSRVVQAIWKASSFTRDSFHSSKWQANPLSSLVNVWWFSYLFHHFLAVLVSVLKHFNSYVHSSLLEMTLAATLSGLVPSFFAVKVVQAIRKRQEQSANFGL